MLPLRFWYHKNMRFAAVVFVKNDAVLIVQQRKKAAMGLWSYPGGAIEDSENSEQAAVRETMEELGVEPVNPLFLKSYPVAAQRDEFTIDTFVGELWGEINLKQDELLAYKWVDLNSLEAMDDLRGDIVIEQARDALNFVRSNLNRTI